MINGESFLNGKKGNKSRKHLSPNQSSNQVGDLRKIAKEIKKDHGLAMELWSTGGVLPRQLAVLIMDKKLLSQELIDQLDKDMQQHPLKGMYARLFAGIY